MFETIQRLLRLTSLWCHAVSSASGQFTLSSLRVKNSLEPLFSWTIRPSEHQVVQTSYQISLSGICPGGQEIWNSGVVISDRTQLIPYTGPQLTSNTRYIWSVNVSTLTGSKVASSEFITGPPTTNGSDYNSAVGKRDNLPPSFHNLLESSSWIWSTDAQSSFQVPPGDRAFRYRFDVPSGEIPISAQVLLSVDDRFSLYANGELVGTSTSELWDRQGFWYSITLVPNMTQIVFAIKATNNGNEDNSGGVIAAMQITFANGTSLSLRSDTQWRSSREALDGFQDLNFNDTNWSPAKSLGRYRVGPWGGDINFPLNPQLVKLQNILLPSTAQSSFTQPPTTIQSPTLSTTASFTITPTPQTTITESFVPPAVSSSKITPLIPGQIQPKASQNIGTIIGVVLGSIFFILLILVLYLWCRRRMGKHTHIELAQSPHPFNLKYDDSGSIHNAPRDEPSSVSSLQHSSSILAVVEGNHGNMSGVQRPDDNPNAGMTRVRLQIMGEQLLALDREINPRGGDGLQATRLLARVAELREQDDNVTLVGEINSQMVDRRMDFRS